MRMMEEISKSFTKHNVAPICGDAVDLYWELVWAGFRELPGWLHLYDEAWTYEQVKKGHLHVWAYSDTEIRGIMVTRINVFPKCKVLDVVGISGHAGLEFMEDLDSVCENLARQQGCSFLVTTARPGMERVLRRKHRAASVMSVMLRNVGLLRRS